MSRAKPTPSPESGLIPAQVAQLDALKDLEFEIYEVTNMADVAADLIEDALSNMDSHRAVTGAPDTFYIPKRQLNRIIFAVNHSFSMANALKEKFHAILEGPREAGEEVHP